MPCYSITTTQIEFGAKTDYTLFAQAMTALGLHPITSQRAIVFDRGSIDKATGRLTLSGSNAEARAVEMRQAYGAEIAKREVARFGWTLQPIAGRPFEYEAVKR